MSTCPLDIPRFNHVASTVPPEALDAIYERALKYRDEDPRVEIEPLHTDDFHVLKLHAFYVRYLLPLQIEVQHFEWAPGFDEQRTA